MRPRERDLLISLGYHGPPPEPLWLPWWQWATLPWACHAIMRPWVRA